MSHPGRIIDSHVHLDHIAGHTPHRIQWLKDRGCAVVSWAWCAKPETVEDMRIYLTGKRAVIHRLNADGLSCGYLAGIHPRNITADMTPEAAVGLVRPFLDDPLCLGIGEIGLEHDDLNEKEILRAQLSLAPVVSAAGKKIGLHTPRGNKTAVTLALLAVLEAMPEIKPMAVIDHCDEKTLPAVLEAGYPAGLTLSPAKTDWHSLPALVETHADAIDRIMCNTDSGTTFHEDLVRAAAAGQIDPAAAGKIFHNNAAIFFNLERYV